MVPVSAAVRRLLLAALAVGSFVVIGAAPAQAACTCPQVTLMDSIKAADAVFTGTVGQVTVTAPPGRTASSAITNIVAVDRVYKGTVDAPDQVVRTTPRTQATCGLGQLGTGSRYVFIVEAAAAGDTEAQWVDEGCSGTRLETDALVTQVRGVLGAGEPAVEPPPPPAAVLTDVDTSEPTTFGRAAAPGAALVLIGLLGLVLVRRLNARRT